MFKLAHFTDPHLGPLPDPRFQELLSKRVIGYVNWRSTRAKALAGPHLDMLVEDIKAHEPDHIALTGDLVNIALHKEIEIAADWLETVGAPTHVSLVPGNHDAYVPGALKQAVRAWKPYMSGDAGETFKQNANGFPYVRRRGDIALIGVSSARASAPWFATGRIGTAQTRSLMQVLRELGRQGLFRVVMIHHPPNKNATGWHKRLTDASRLRAALQEWGAELVLHGHTHLATRNTLPGPNGPIPVICAPSASNGRPQSAHRHSKPAARYNLFEITRTDDGWRCNQQERGFEGAHETIKTLSNIELAIPVPAKNQRDKANLKPAQLSGLKNHA